MMIRLMIYIAVITLLAISLPSETRAQGVITIDLSYKVVLNPADGSRPPGATNMAIDSAVRAMNAMYETYFRGYRFRRVDPIMQIGSQGDTTGPSRWYNTNFFDDDNGADWKDQMEDEARDDPRYAWNDNATNIYITNGICGGICSFPGDHIIIIGGCAANNGPVQLHEIGHYFDLCHTQGCPCGNCNPMRSGECHTEPGDDNIDDTLPDLQCWDRNNIANWSFGTSYANLSAGQQTRVDNVFFNIMSYHGSITRLTELQLDRWADTANDDRENVRSGRTIFVATELGGLFPNGSSTRPFITVQSGVDEANPDGGDIVLLRPGAYNETLTISKPVTLRATRQGPVAIGASVAPSLAARQSPEEIDAALKKVPGIVVEDVGARLDFAGGGKKQRQ